MGADRGSTAIGTFEYQRRPDVASQPVRLAPRPAFLAGREELLAELDARLTGTQGGSGPRLVALCGLGGAGKTSVAVEYAHRHLAEVAVCWQFAAEDPAVLAAESAVLAAQLGAREIIDPRDAVASVHAVLARQEAGWLMVFDNAPDRASVERFVPPAGPGRLLITTQNQHWPPGQAALGTVTRISALLAAYNRMRCERPLAGILAGRGRFAWWWQVVDSNHRRRSRRFYRPSPAMP